MDYADIRHGNGTATLTANDARPLAQAVVALRQEYGWFIDYEDPVYSGSELMDVTGEDWPSSYPHAAGLRRPAGGAFTTTYSEKGAGAAINADQERTALLHQVLVDYSRSGNPGTFTVVQTAPGRVDVVGHNGLQPAVLDTEVSVSPEGRPAFEALEAILKSVQKQTGHRIGLGLVPTNMLMQCTISQPFTNERARSAILETLNLCHADLVWQFLYDANHDRYLLNLDAAAMAYRDATGHRLLAPAPSQR